MSHLYRRQFLQYFLLGVALSACQGQVSSGEDTTEPPAETTEPGTSDESSAGPDALDAIKERKKMIVAVDPTFAPFEFTDDTGKITGYDPALAEKIAQSLGVEIEYQQMPFSGIIPGIIAGSFDFSISALNVTAERAEKIDYTIPIAESVNAVLKRSDDTSIADTNPATLAGKKLGVKVNTQPEQMMQEISKKLEAEGKAPIEFVSVDTVEQTLSALVSKRVDFVVDDLIVLTQAIKERTDVKMEVVGKLGDRALIAWGTNKKDKQLNAYLNEQITKLKADGTLTALQQEFFGLTFEDLPTEDFIPKA
jgi:polar amino acid transport system substrate-binding protein